MFFYIANGASNPFRDLRIGEPFNTMKQENFLRPFVQILYAPC